MKSLYRTISGPANNTDSEISAAMDQGMQLYGNPYVYIDQYGRAIANQVMIVIGEEAKPQAKPKTKRK